MVKIAFVSAHSNAGKTTVVINIAAGLALKGFHPLILFTTNDQTACTWLRIGSLPLDSPGMSSMGFDYLQIILEDTKPDSALTLLEEKLVSYNYDYILIDSAPSNINQEICTRLADIIIYCINLIDQAEIETLLAFKNHIDLVLPARINTREWEHNSSLLDDIALQLGYEYIGDMLPT